MQVSAYDAFVKKTDQTGAFSAETRMEIALYGVASEIGSVVSAVKKRLLANAGQSAWNVPDDDVIEELGDVMWYCFALARHANPGGFVNIFGHDIAQLKAELGGSSERAERLGQVLDRSKREQFLSAAQAFPRRTRDLTFEDYQDLAFLTARTADRVLAEVCLVVLQQLGAELLRRGLPPIERELNTILPDRPINDILGEIAWHVAALSSLYGLRLSQIAERNVTKISDRWDRSIKTPLHDAKFESSERFPRKFEVEFVPASPARSRMFYNGEQLGDDLTDNAYDDDGYRFHDVMHLANVAKLGWSPVLRKLMKLKRKSQPKIDEVEDGARARIVEEAVIKAIHAEGVRLADKRLGPRVGPVRLFPNSAEISFAFLKGVRALVAGLEVAANRAWEWEAAILDGYRIFHRLRVNDGGFVSVDLDGRSITFRPRSAPEAGVSAATSSHVSTEVDPEIVESA